MAELGTRYHHITEGCGSDNFVMPAAVLEDIFHRGEMLARLSALPCRQCARLGWDAYHQWQRRRSDNIRLEAMGMAPNEAARPCVQCVNCLVDDRDPGQSRCRLNVIADPVTGEPRTRYCSIERGVGTCGIEGKNWRRIESAEQQAA